MTRSLCVLAPLLIVVASTSACRDKSSTTSTAQPPASAAPSSSGASSSSPAASRDASVVESRAFHGTLPSSRSFRLYIERRGAALTAIYDVDGAGGAVMMRGKVTDATHWHLEDVLPSAGGKAPREGLHLVLDPSGAIGGKATDGATGVVEELHGEPNVPFADDKGFTESYAGSLGGTLRIRANLTRDGGALRGTYRYARSKSDLALTGTLDPKTGGLDLTEKNGDGPKATVTGKMQGFFLDKNVLVGTWSSPDGARSLPFVLEKADAYPTTLALGGGARLVPQEDFSQHGKSCTSSVLYPSIEGLADKAVQSKLDALLKQEATSSVTLGREDCEGATAEMPYQVEGSYSAVAKKGYVAIDLAGDGFTGGAHGMVWQKCFVLDLTKGEKVPLIGLVLPGGRARLDAMVQSRLRKEHGVKDLTEAGFFDAHPQISDTTNLCLRDAGIDVEFGDYEIAPHVVGPQQVQLSAAEIRPLFVTGPVVAALLGP